MRYEVKNVTRSDICGVVLQSKVITVQLFLVVCVILACSSVISDMRLKYPAMTTLGGDFCDLYSLVRDSWRASRDWRWSFGGR